MSVVIHYYSDGDSIYYCLYETHDKCHWKLPATDTFVKKCLSNAQAESEVKELRKNHIKGGAQ